MDSTNLETLADELIAAAHAADSGRASRTVHGGTGHPLRQTVLALVAGRALAEHDSPGDATLQVVRGRLRLTAGELSWEGRAGELVTIPPSRHGLTALEDAVAVLTVVAAL